MHSSSLDLLRAGRTAWNAWRAASPLVRPQLVGADLEGLDLRGADLRSADLRDAVLDRAVISGCSFHNATLVGASLDNTIADGATFSDCFLSSAQLGGASLIGADFVQVIADGANFSGCDLRRARIDDSTLDGASFKHATVGNTGFLNLDLSTVDLEDMKVLGPCDIGMRTLELTAEHLGSAHHDRRPLELFFEDCGLSEAAIEYFRSRIGQPIQHYTAFISYSHADRTFARRLRQFLHSRGIRSWLDEHDLLPGDRILEGVNEAIRLHDRIILCCSKSSLTSWWVKDEIRKAQEKERKLGRDVIIPILLDDYLLADWDDGLAADIRSRNAADFRTFDDGIRAFEEAAVRLCDALTRAQTQGGSVA
jgi:uncharacterized protein YjbI with pentapeptide repeats